MNKFFCLLIGVTLLVAACSKEENTPLPDLPKIAHPEGFVGQYSGRLPCESCKARMMRISLNGDSSVVAIETLVSDSAKTDTVSGRFSVDSARVSVFLDNGEKFNFTGGSSGELYLLTGAGTVYEDENGVKAGFVKILKAPKVTKTTEEVKDGR